MRSENRNRKTREQRCSFVCLSRHESRSAEQPQCIGVAWRACEHLETKRRGRFGRDRLGPVRGEGRGDISRRHREGNDGRDRAIQERHALARPGQVIDYVSAHAVFVIGAAIWLASRGSIDRGLAEGTPERAEEALEQA